MLGKVATTLALLLGLGIVQTAQAQGPLPLFLPEQRTIEVRDPGELAPAPLLSTPAPPTVSTPVEELQARMLSLDEAIRSALGNAEVVRILAGVTAVSSGQTIYDVAAANTANDQARGRFDPTVEVNNSWNRNEPPFGRREDAYHVSASVAKATGVGGTASINASAAPTTIRPVLPTDLLNPSSLSSLDVRYTQPLLRGAGFRPNLAPLVIARINTERSFFQFKDSVQELVRSVIEAYWAMVFARTDVWAREQQVRQAEFAYNLAEAGLQVGRVNLGEVAQTKTALASFRVTYLNARANLLQREAAFRNLLGFPPYDPEQIVPVTPPIEERLAMDWQQIVDLAGEYRPDLIELKLILEADQQQLYQLRNAALPQLDAAALYRWNGLEGEVPLVGTKVSSGQGQFTDWALAVNFSVPLGLRQSRASLRNQELLISRDRANLQQGLHAAAHDLALSLRNLAQFYEQYLAYTELREAAETNLTFQLARWRNGQVNFLVVQQAIADWGNAVSFQAQTLLQYNTELASLERRTGTILETHGIWFYEERYGSVGPLGRLHRGAAYPQSLPPTFNAERYETGTEPSEKVFDLNDPVANRRRRNSEEVPPPAAPLPPAIDPLRRPGEGS